MTYESVIESQKGVRAGDILSKMKKKQGYRVLPFKMNRRMVAASASVGREQNNIQAIIEVDIPGFLFCTFIRLASQNIRMRERCGTVGITAVGMFSNKNQAA